MPRERQGQLLVRSPRGARAAIRRRKASWALRLAAGPVEDGLMTYPDWLEPARLLREVTGPATKEQLRVAEALGVQYSGQPRAVFSAVIEAWLQPTLWLKRPLPATDRQVDFLEQLGHHDDSGSLLRPVASAWIDHYLSLRTATDLEALKPRRGDRLHYENLAAHPETGEVIDLGGEVTVSSIGARGLVYFRGGNGRCGWPGKVRHISRSASRSAPLTQEGGS